MAGWEGIWPVAPTPFDEDGRLDEDGKSAFFGLPVLVGVGTGHETCPVTLVSASTDRRRGDYLFSVARHLVSN